MGCIFCLIYYKNLGDVIFDLLFLISKPNMISCELPKFFLGPVPTS